jgi:hypothetical protein
MKKMRKTNREEVAMITKARCKANSKKREKIVKQ